MFIIADWILVLGTLATCFYCWTVSKSLRRVQERTVEMLAALEGLEGRAEAVREAGRRVVSDLKWVENSLMDERARAMRALEVASDKTNQVRTLENRAGAAVERLLEAAQSAREAKHEIVETMTDYEAMRAVTMSDIASLEETVNRLSKLDPMQGEVIETKKTRSRAKAASTSRSTTSRKSAPKTTRTRKSTRSKKTEAQLSFDEVDHFEPIG